MAEPGEARALLVLFDALEGDGGRELGGGRHFRLAPSVELDRPLGDGALSDRELFADEKGRAPDA
jgi:hypothetical protein